MRHTFAEDVRKGLSAAPKFLPSRYFYDQKGDELFQAIMNMPEYYLTDAEYEVFSMQKEQIVQHIHAHDKPFHLVEFGAGDGLKTKLLLEELENQRAQYTYVPIDISANAIEGLQQDLKENFPSVVVEPMVNEYFKALTELSHKDNDPKVILFLGSNIGNFLMPQAKKFLQGLAKRMNPDDLLLIGVDLKKDPAIILNAYNDKGGITRAFNLNLLRRINRELGGDFDLTQFTHWPIYHPETGECRSFLVSLRKQEVKIAELGKTFSFGPYETIYTEVSKKYGLHELESLAQATGFTVNHHFFDCKHYFVDTLWQPVKI